eukprot:TRINITY_DN1182_c0_g1_i4.p1 TRINITY_DN1182_c0_g1~~TRINITY_DN1182_c0_g1_i4.p1  ORF type:complete len:2391 (+),score=493.30 TRINITY_DN1182_c0_g1_i4:114-7175(+)
MPAAPSPMTALAHTSSIDSCDLARAAIAGATDPTFANTPGNARGNLAVHAKSSGIHVISEASDGEVSDGEVSSDASAASPSPAAQSAELQQRAAGRRDVPPARSRSRTPPPRRVGGAADDGSDSEGEVSPASPSASAKSSEASEAKAPDAEPGKADEESDGEVSSDDGKIKASLVVSDKKKSKRDQVSFDDDRQVKDSSANPSSKCEPEVSKHSDGEVEDSPTAVGNPGKRAPQEAQGTPSCAFSTARQDVAREASLDEGEVKDSPSGVVSSPSRKEKRSVSNGRMAEESSSDEGEVEDSPAGVPENKSPAKSVDEGEVEDSDASVEKSCCKPQSAICKDDAAHDSSSDEGEVEDSPSGTAEGQLSTKSIVEGEAEDLDASVAKSLCSSKRALSNHNASEESSSSDEDEVEDSPPGIVEGQSPTKSVDDASAAKACCKPQSAIPKGDAAEDSSSDEGEVEDSQTGNTDGHSPVKLVDEGGVEDSDASVAKSRCSSKRTTSKHHASEKSSSDEGAAEHSPTGHAGGQSPKKSIEDEVSCSDDVVASSPRKLQTTLWKENDARKASSDEGEIVDSPVVFVVSCDSKPKPAACAAEESLFDKGEAESSPVGVFQGQSPTKCVDYGEVNVSDDSVACSSKTQPTASQQDSAHELSDEGKVEDSPGCAPSPFSGGDLRVASEYTSRSKSVDETDVKDSDDSAASLLGTPQLVISKKHAAEGLSRGEGDANDFQIDVARPPTASDRSADETSSDEGEVEESSLGATSSCAKSASPMANKRASESNLVDARVAENSVDIVPSPSGKPRSATSRNNQLQKSSSDEGEVEDSPSGMASPCIKSQTSIVEQQSGQPRSCDAQEPTVSDVIAAKLADTCQWASSEARVQDSREAVASPRGNALSTAKEKSSLSVKDEVRIPDNVSTSSPGRAAQQHGRATAPSDASLGLQQQQGPKGEANGGFTAKERGPGASSTCGEHVGQHVEGLDVPDLRTEQSNNSPDANAESRSECQPTMDKLANAPSDDDGEVDDSPANVASSVSASPCTKGPLPRCEHQASSDDDGDVQSSPAAQPCISCKEKEVGSDDDGEVDDSTTASPGSLGKTSPPILERHRLSNGCAESSKVPLDPLEPCSSERKGEKLSPGESGDVKQTSVTSASLDHKCESQKMQQSTCQPLSDSDGEVEDSLESEQKEKYAPVERSEDHASSDDGEVDNSPVVGEVAAAEDGKVKSSPVANAIASSTCLPPSVETSPQVSAESLVGNSLPPSSEHEAKHMLSDAGEDVRKSIVAAVSPLRESQPPVQESEQASGRVACSNGVKENDSHVAASPAQKRQRTTEALADRASSDDDGEVEDPPVENVGADRQPPTTSDQSSCMAAIGDRKPQNDSPGAGSASKDKLRTQEHASDCALSDAGEVENSPISAVSFSEQCHFESPVLEPSPLQPKRSGSAPVDAESPMVKRQRQTTSCTSNISSEGLPSSELTRAADPVMSEANQNDSDLDPQSGSLQAPAMQAELAAKEQDLVVDTNVALHLTSSEDQKEGEDVHEPAAKRSRCEALADEENRKKDTSRLFAQAIRDSMNLEMGECSGGEEASSAGEDKAGKPRGAMQAVDLEADDSDGEEEHHEHRAARRLCAQYEQQADRKSASASWCSGRSGRGKAKSLPSDFASPISAVNAEKRRPAKRRRLRRVRRDPSSSYSESSRSSSCSSSSSSSTWSSSSRSRRKGATKRRRQKKLRRRQQHRRKGGAMKKAATSRRRKSDDSKQVVRHSGARAPAAAGESERPRRRGDRKAKKQLRRERLTMQRKLELSQLLLEDAKATVTGKALVSRIGDVGNEGPESALATIAQLRSVGSGGVPVKEIYIGGLREGVTEPHDVTCMLRALLRQLPEYLARYGEDFDPIGCERRMPPASAPKYQGKFCFVRMADNVLAATAVAMSGFLVHGVSLRVSWGTYGRCDDEPLDVSMLRAEGLIPFSSGEGARMLRKVFIGNLDLSLSCDNGRSLTDGLNSLITGMPSVKARYPEIEVPVTDVQLLGRFAFVELANEVLASTLVAMAEVVLPTGQCLATGWPSNVPDATVRAPLPLAFEPVRGMKALKDDAAVPDALKLGCGVNKSSFGGKLPPNPPCEVFVGGVRDVETLNVIQAAEALLRSLPAYQRVYMQDGKDQKSVVALTRGSRDFAFMRTLDPVLASTLVAIGFMKVGNFRLPLSRPLTYKTPESGDVPPLDIASFMATNPDAPQPPPPPPVRTMRCTNDLWVGNLHPPDADPTLLEEHLTRVALESPGYDMESGPPIKTLVLHYSRRYAFVRLRNDDLLAKLQPVFDGSLFCGRALAVNLSRRNTAAALTCGVGVRRPAPGLDDVDAEDL